MHEQHSALNVASLIVICVIFVCLFSVPTDVVHGIILLHSELCWGTVHWPEGEVLQEKKWISCTGTSPIQEVSLCHHSEAHVQ